LERDAVLHFEAIAFYNETAAGHRCVKSNRCSGKTFLRDDAVAPFWGEIFMPDVQTATRLDEIIENFNFLDDWEDRYRYLIELGRGLEPLDEAAHNEMNKVRGCVSQVWLETRVAKDDTGCFVLYLKGDSDAHIVRGLVALILAIYSGQTASRVLTTDAEGLFESLGLSTHLTPQRSNGVRSMVERIKNDARSAV
jgi:cysteine desulfuration protein SufE